MKRLITTIAAMLSLIATAQTPVMDINYYNSLQWKTAKSMQVYIDCTYTLPTRQPRVKYIYRQTYWPWPPYVGPRWYPTPYSLVYTMPTRHRHHCR